MQYIYQKYLHNIFRFYISENKSIIQTFIIKYMWVLKKGKSVIIKLYKVSVLSISSIKNKWKLFSVIKLRINI